MHTSIYRSGFVSLLGKPNAGKSTLLNALIGEKMAIVSHKVQTTRHRIKAFLTADDYQIVLSDTPGIITPKYRLHEKMMQQVKGAVEDADLALLLYDLTDKQPEEAHTLFASLKLRVPAIVVLNKKDAFPSQDLGAVIDFFAQQPYCKRVVPIAAKNNEGVDDLLAHMLPYMPEGDPFFSQEDLSDLPTRFFVSELIREQIFDLYHEEIPYQTTVLVQEFKEKTTLVKIQADIIVHRDTQKFIIIGEKGRMIKTLGTRAREAIEAFIDQKVFLELFVKVRPKWRDDELKLREYGY